MKISNAIALTTTVACGLILVTEWAHDVPLSGLAGLVGLTAFGWSVGAFVDWVDRGI